MTALRFKMAAIFHFCYNSLSGRFDLELGMTVMLGLYAMYLLEMTVEGGYLKNLTGATLAAVGNFFLLSGNFGD